MSALRGDARVFADAVHVVPVVGGVPSDLAGADARLEGAHDRAVDVLARCDVGAFSRTVSLGGLVEFGERFGLS